MKVDFYTKSEVDQKINDGGNVTPEQIEQLNANTAAINGLTADVATKAPVIVNDESGSVIGIDDGLNTPVNGLRIYGRSTQDGTPTPDAPIEIESVADDGNLTVTTIGGNLFVPESMSYTNRYSIRNDGFVVYSNPTQYSEYSKADIKLPYGKYTVTVEIESITGVGAVYVGANSADWSRPLKATRTVYLQTDTVMICFSGKDGAAITARVRIYSGDTATEYEPYKGTTTANITSISPLRSVGDVRDELVFNADGTAKIIKRFENLVLNGSENWTAGTTGNADIRRMMYYPAKASNTKGNNVNANGLCSHYNVITANDTYSEATLTVGIAMSTAQYIAIYDTRFNTVESLSNFKAWLAENPVTFVYELQTPEEIALTAEDAAAIKELLTYDGTTTAFNDEGAEMTLSYLANTKRYIDKRLNALTNAILSMGGNV